VSAQREQSGEKESENAPASPAGRPSVVVARPGAFLTLVILGLFGMGLAIYWLLRGMHI
jgi:hypothetical protein